MRSVHLDFADRAFPVSIVEVPEPALPRDDWARVQVTRGGICGSDLNVIRPKGSGSAVLGPYVAFPMEMGHEIAGVVIETGPDCPVATGTRVAVDPVIACAARGLPLCERCRDGATSACLQIGSRTVTEGLGLGFTNGLGAGWSEQLVAHAGQLHRIPDAVDDRTAALTEPLSVSIHGLLRRPPADGAPALVVGAGIIGLAAVAALRHLFPASEVTVLAKHDHQAAAARRLGATHIVRPDGTDPFAPLGELATITGAKLTGSGESAMLAGGFPVVVEAVGSAPTVDLALRAAAQRGVVHLVGVIGRAPVDLAPLWFKELDIVGSFCHAADGHAGPAGHSFDRALAVLEAGDLPADAVVTHEVPLDELRAAVETGLDRERGAIKVLLVPSGKP